jgi:hypothetical protein
MNSPRVDQKAIGIVEDMIQHVLTRPSMYGCPSDVESTALTLAALWEQFHAKEHNGDGIWIIDARVWWELWMAQIRSIHGDTNVLRLSDPTSPTVDQTALMEQVVRGMKNLFDSLFETYLEPQSRGTP